MCVCVFAAVSGDRKGGGQGKSLIVGEERAGRWCCGHELVKKIKGVEMDSNGSRGGLSLVFRGEEF